mgnify:CR=1 FL=1
MFSYLKLLVLFVLSLFGCFYLLAKSKKSKNFFAFLFLAVADIIYLLLFLSLKLDFYAYFPFPSDIIHGLKIVFIGFISSVIYYALKDYENEKNSGFLKLFFVLFVFGSIYYLLDTLLVDDLSPLAKEKFREFYNYISRNPR